MLSDYIMTGLQYVIPKKCLTILLGCLANIDIPLLKNFVIRTFIQKYNVNMQEAVEENPINYRTFNDFFTRHLKPNLRPLADKDIVSPVDGFVSEIGKIMQGKLLQAKGRDYSVQDLLACDPIQSAQFNDGAFATLYLSPRDYHRIHMPITGTLKQMIYVPGKLFSVQPSSTRMIPKLFARNKRLVTFFDTELGPMAMVLVGATIVGAIGTSWHGDLARSRQQHVFEYPTPITLKKGEEMGYFKLGSTVILLFANGQAITWNSKLRSQDTIQLGQGLGEHC